jgi:hypothetical protein
MRFYLGAASSMPLGKTQHWECDCSNIIGGWQFASMPIQLARGALLPNSKVSHKKIPSRGRSAHSLNTATEQEQ